MGETNVFDIVDEFYTQDPGWNEVLERRYVENYLRSLAMQGEDDDMLTDIWSNIMLLCVFLGNSENFLGDMSRENFIDCVGWCGRNVAGFTLNPTHVEEFLGDMANFYAYLKKRRIVIYDEGPREALAKLVVNNKLQLMDRKGHFLSDVEKYNVYSSPDLPAKIFLNVGEKLDNLLDALRNFYQNQQYARDVQRAAFLFSGIVTNKVINEEPQSEEYAQSFWDYFLFDYHLLGNDKRPIQHFYDDMCVHNFTEEGAAYEDILLELLETKLVVFKVLSRNEDNTYSCQDIFSNAGYSLMLPLPEDAETENILFLGHIYYNESMLVNFMRGFKVLPAAQKRMKTIAKKAKAFFGLRTQGGMDWDEFIGRNGMFIRHLLLIFSAFMRLDCFNHESRVESYTPAPLVQDAVSEKIAAFMQPYAFSAYDIHLCQSMWSDFVAKYPKKVRLPEIWAAGIIRNFVDVSGVYNYEPQQVAEMCHNVPVTAVYRTSNEISHALVLEQGDPRYINEEGLLLLLLT